MSITRPSPTFLREGGSRDGSSPAESLGTDESTADRVVRVPWGERFDAAVYFLGYSRLATTSSGTVTALERLTPMPHPDLSGMLYATRTPEIVGWRFTEKRSAADGTTGNQFSKAHVRVGYEHVPYNVKEDYGAGSGNDISDVYAEWERFTYVSDVRPSAEYLSLPNGALRYLTASGTPSPPSGLPVPFGIGKVLSLTEVDVRWVTLPYDLYSLVSPSAWQRRVWGDPASNVKPLIGRVNKSQMWSWAPGTALLQNVKLETRKHPTIGLSWDVTFTFNVNTNADGNGWNYGYYFPTDAGSSAGAGWYFMGSGAYHAPGSVPDGTSLYDEAEMLGAGGVFDVTG